MAEGLFTSQSTKKFSLTPLITQANQTPKGLADDMRDIVGLADATTSFIQNKAIQEKNQQALQIHNEKTALKTAWNNVRYDYYNSIRGKEDDYEAYATAYNKFTTDTDSLVNVQGVSDEARNALMESVVPAQKTESEAFFKEQYKHNLTVFGSEVTEGIIARGGVTPEDYKDFMEVAKAKGVKPNDASKSIIESSQNFMKVALSDPNIPFSEAVKVKEGLNSLLKTDASLQGKDYFVTALNSVDASLTKIRNYKIDTLTSFIESNQVSIEDKFNAVNMAEADGVLVGDQANTFRYDVQNRAYDKDQAEIKSFLEVRANDPYNYIPGDLYNRAIKDGFSKQAAQTLEAKGTAVFVGHTVTAIQANASVLVEQAKMPGFNSEAAQISLNQLTTMANLLPASERGRIYKMIEAIRTSVTKKEVKDEVTNIKDNIGEYSKSFLNIQTLLDEGKISPAEADNLRVTLSRQQDAEIEKANATEDKRLANAMVVSKKRINAVYNNPETTLEGLYDVISEHGQGLLPEEVSEMIATMMHKQRKEGVSAQNALENAEKEIAGYIVGTEDMPAEEKRALLKGLSSLPKEYVRMQISKINKKEVDDEIARFNAETKEMTELDKAEVSRMKERIALDNRVINATIANPESTYGEVYDALRMYGGSKLPEEIHEILATFVYKQKEALRVDENRQVAADNILKGAQMELAKWIKGTDSMPFDERKNILRALPLLPKEFVDKSISDLDKEQRELDVARVTANKKEEVIVAKNRVNDVVALADQGAPIQMTFSDFVNIVGAGYGGEEIPQRVLTLLNRFTDKTTQARVINDILNNRETVGDVNPDNFFDMAASKNQAVTNMLDKTLSNINTPEDVDAVLAKVDALSQVNYSFDDKHDASIKWLKYLSGTRDSTTALEIYKLATKPGAKLNSEQAKALIGNLRRNDITTTYSISSPGMGAIAKVVDLVSSAQLTDSEAKEFLDGFVQDKFIGYSTLFGIGDTVPTFIPKTSHINNEKAYAKVLKNASDLVSGKVTLVFPAKPYDAENSNWNITYMENNMLRTKTIDIDTLNALARGTHKKDK